MYSVTVKHKHMASLESLVPARVSENATKPEFCSLMFVLAGAGFCVKKLQPGILI